MMKSNHCFYFVLFKIQTFWYLPRLCIKSMEYLWLLLSPQELYFPALKRRKSRISPIQVKNTFFTCVFLSCHVPVFKWIYSLQSPNIKELLARNSFGIWSLMTVTGFEPRELANTLISPILKNTSFTWMFLSCHIRVLEWIYPMQLPECQITPSSKQAKYLKCNWNAVGFELKNT